MRRIAIMTLSGKSELYPEIDEIVKDFVIRSKITMMKNRNYSDMFSITMYEDFEAYDKLMNIIKEHNIDYTFSEGREYTKKEINDAAFLDIEVVYPWEHDIKHPEDYGTKYSYENKCNACGMGKTQISELVINTKKIKKGDIITINPEIMISKRLHDMIIDNGLTGCEFGPVRDYKGRDDEIYYQLKINSILPPMDSQTKLIVKDNRYCYVCRKNGIFLDSEIIYKSSDIENARDFNLSEEYVGLANYCKQRIIVSNKFFDLYMKSKMKGINFVEPIKIV